GDLALDAQQLAATRVDLLLRDALGEQRGDGAFFAGEVEDADVIELGLAHEVAQLLERRLCLARVAGDEGGAEGAVGDARAEALDQVADLSLAVPAPHRLEHAAVDVLDRNVEVAGHPRLPADRVEQLVAAGGGVSVVEPDPAEAVDGPELAQQRGQPRRPRILGVRQIGPVGRQVLRDETDLLGAAGDQVARLAGDRLGRAAALRPAQLGDDAEGAGAIAPLGDLHVGAVRRLRAAARGRVVVEIRRRVDDAQPRAGAGDRLGDRPDLVGADEVVDLRHLVRQLFRVALGQAPGHHQPLAGAGLLVARHLQDGVDRLLLRLADEAAGVDHDDLGRPGLGHQLVAGLGRVPEHDLGVDAVLGTAEGDEVNVHRKAGKVSTRGPRAPKQRPSYGKNSTSRAPSLAMSSRTFCWMTWRRPTTAAISAGVRMS